MKRTIGNAVVELFQGDITDLDTDAIVNAANSHLWMGAGVAGAIKRKGGPEIESEAVGKGPIPVGEAVVTGAGRLKTRFVIHAAAMGQDLETDERKIRAATANSLCRARELAIESIAFPALGAGVGGFPLSKVAAIMLDEVERHLHGGENSVTRIVFSLFGAEAFHAFELELEKHAGPT
ncbi:MAG: macro domain-containing protein [Dehalococcoidia bacterium]|nr:macro domain-containing protein [Dehalococcoidia bacterium]